jgi:hypothetical protein
VNVHEFELGQREGASDGLEIDLLPARHAARAGGERERFNHFELRARVVGKALIGEELERRRLKGIADEERRGLVELDMHGGLAAAQDVVVHARQVVMHQRVRVDQLDRARRDLETLGRRVSDFACGESEQRPHALAAFERRVAHCLVQARGSDVRCRQKARERAFHARLHVAHPGLKVTVAQIHQRRPPGA